MPIIGMTDASTAMPRFPRLGVLRKGAPRPEGGRRPGSDLEWFRFDASKPAIGEAFARAYGTQPDSLTVFLPYALISDCFPTWREEWVAGGLVHRCDGQTCSVWRNAQGRYSRDPKPCPYLQVTDEAKGCKPIGRLNLILPDLLRAGFVGYVSLGTTSINDIVSIHASLLAVAEARGNEDLRGIAFQLYRQKEEISTPGKDGQRMRREVSLVKLVPSVEWVRGQLAASAREALALPEGVLLDETTGELLDAPDDDDVIDAPAQAPPKAEPKAEPPKPPPAAPGKTAEEWVSEFLTKAVSHYQEANPGIEEPQVLDALGMTREEFVEAAGGAVDAKALKAKLDAAFSEQVSF